MCPLSLKTSDSTQILATGKAKMWVLLVGVNHYQDEAFPNLDYSAMDCRELGGALQGAIADFPSQTVMIHHDFADRLPTFAAIEQQLQRIASEARPQDTVLVYFSGHGVIDAHSQQAVLCLRDTQSQALLETGLRMQAVLQRLETCAARQQLLWLDACHSGSLIVRGARDAGEPILPAVMPPATMTSVAIDPNPTQQLVKVLRSRAAQSRGFYALLSCDEGQRSWEFPELGHGVFTYYLIQGLRGAAADADGVIEADALYRYVYRQTVHYIDQKNQQLRQMNEEKRQRRESPLYPEYPPQTPKRIVEGVGELVLGLVSSAGIAPPPAAEPVAPNGRTEDSSTRPLNPSQRLDRRFENRLAEITALSRDAMDRETVPLDSPPREYPASETTIPYTLDPAGAEAQFLSPTPHSLQPTELDSAAPTSDRALTAGDRRKRLALVALALGAAVLLPIGLGWRPWRTWSVPWFETVGSQARNIKAKTVQNQAEQPFDAQILLDNCEAGGNWRHIKVQTLTQHLGAVWAVAFTSDGNTLASASASGVEIWDLRNQRLQRLLEGHTSQIHAVDISSNGQLLASASGDQTVKIWNVATGELRHTLTGHSSTVWSVAISPDGQTLASSSSDRTIKLWNLQTGELRQTLTGHQDWVFSVTFSPDGQTLASASQDRTIKLWDWQNGRELRSLSGHSDAVRSIAFDPRGQHLASASWDRTLNLWDVDTGQVLHSFSGHSDRVVSLAFSPDGQTLASGSVDRTVKLWSLENQASIATLYGHTDWVLAVDFSPDGNTLVSGSRDQVITLWKR